MTEAFIFTSGDLADTDRLGIALAELLPASAAIALVGPLGAGKTRLVQAVAEAAGIAKEVVASPTFVLVHEYAGPVPIFHFDAYRLRDEDEFLNLGSDEYFARPGWSFIEWADRVANCLPKEHLEITIEPTGPSTRRFALRAVGGKYQMLLEQLKEQIANK